MFQETAHPLSSRSRLSPSAPRSSLSSSSSIYDASQHLFTPDIRKPRVVLDGVTFLDQLLRRNSDKRFACLSPARSLPPRVMLPSENVAASSSPLTYDQPTKQRASHSLKRAGAETTCETARIKHPILPHLCFNDPPAGGGSQQVILPEAVVIPGVPAAAVVRISKGERHYFGAAMPFST